MAASSPRCVHHTLFTSQAPPAKLPPTNLPLTQASAKPVLSNAPPSPTSVHGTPLVSASTATPVAKLHSSPPVAPTESRSEVQVHQQSPSSSSRSSHAPWLPALLSTKFYTPCPHHSGLRKNDQNLFCTTHACKICQYCHRAEHSTSSCTVLHVSRYMYHDVLLAREAGPLLPLTHVQSYLNNGNRVVYLDRRAQPRSKLPPHARSCVVCERTLQDPYRFCSVFCSLVFANDPAAHPELPIPDATPLPHLPLRKPTRKTENASTNCPSASSPSFSTVFSPSSSLGSSPISSSRIINDYSNNNINSRFNIATERNSTLPSANTTTPSPLPPPLPPPLHPLSSSIHPTAHNAPPTKPKQKTTLSFEARIQTTTKPLSTAACTARATECANHHRSFNPTNNGGNLHDTVIKRTREHEEKTARNVGSERQTKRAKEDGTSGSSTRPRSSPIPIPIPKRESSSDGNDAIATAATTTRGANSTLRASLKHGRRKSKPRPSVVPVADGWTMTRLLFPYPAHT